VGGLSRRKADRGYILLDVLVGLFIILLGFGVFLGGLSVSARTAARRDARVHAIIEQRNSHATDHTVLFQGE
jgi:hypothetical protein